MDPYDIYMQQQQEWQNEITKRDDYIKKLEESEEQKISRIKDLEDLLFKAESDRTYWFDMFGQEKHVTLEMANEIERLNKGLEVNLANISNQTNEIDRLRQEIAKGLKLKERLEDLDEKNEDLENRLFVKEQKVIEFESDIANKTKYIYKQIEYIKSLEHDIQTITNLSNLRQNEISGLQKILDEKDIEIEGLKKSLKERNRVDEYTDQLLMEKANEITNLKIELEASDRNTEAFGSLLKDRVSDVRRLREALQWYANKENIKSRIKETLRYIGGDLFTDSSMYDNVTKVAEKALEETK